MTVDLKTKRLLIGQPPPCTHQGYLVPVLSMVQTIPMPEDPDAKPPEPKKAKLFTKGETAPPPAVITFVRTVEAICCRCNAVIKFGPPPQAPPAESPNPAPVPGNDTSTAL